MAAKSKRQWSARIRRMNRARRFVAFLALLAVGWTALWPLVSAAHARATSQPVLLCHQAGGVVPMDEAPTAPGAPGTPKQHCPLCIMAFYCGFCEPPRAPDFSFPTALVVRDVVAVAHTHGVEVALPFGRAPPASSFA
jgi:hypothetical protein